MAAPFGLRAEYLGDIRTVGVQGDARTYTPAIVLCGSYPGEEVLAFLGNAIPNRLPINRVTYESAVRNIRLEEILSAEQLELLRSSKFG